MKYYIYFIHRSGVKYYYHGNGFSKNIKHALLYDHKNDAYTDRGVYLTCEDIKYNFLVNGGITIDNKRLSFGFSESVKKNDES